jgi:hypothetical protein
VTVSIDSRIQSWDGTYGPVSVKAANVSPTLADLPLVSALSPNNTGLPVNIPAIVQKTSNVSSGSVASLAKAFSSNNVAGNSIIVVCGVGNGTAPTISDSNSNTYTRATQVANGTALNVAVFYAVGIVGGANTVTVNNGGTTASIVLEMYEVSGLIAQIQAQPDQTATNTGSSGTASAVAIAATYPNEWAFAAVGVGTAAQTITVGSGWTNDSGQQNPTTPAGLFSFVSMSQYLAAQVFVTPQATFTSEPWAIAVASFNSRFACCRNDAASCRGERRTNSQPYHHSIWHKRNIAQSRAGAGVQPASEQWCRQRVLLPLLQFGGCPNGWHKHGLQDHPGTRERYGGCGLDCRSGVLNRDRLGLYWGHR